MTTTESEGCSTSAFPLCLFGALGVFGVDFLGRLADFGVAPDFFSGGFLAGVMRSFMGAERTAGRGGAAALVALGERPRPFPLHRGRVRVQTGRRGPGPDVRW